MQMDPQSCSILSAHRAVYEYKKQKFIMINATVCDSMKDAIYNTTTCFSNITLLLCSCDCKYGGETGTRIVHVHVPTLGVSLSPLLMDGLSEHILLENLVLFCKSLHTISESQNELLIKSLLHLILVVDSSKFISLLKNNFFRTSYIIAKSTG